MSVIDKPGFYRQRNGGKAEVFADRDGFWYGRHLEERDDQEWTGTCWTRKGRWLTDADDGHADCCPHDITGPWIEEPDPGEGWRLLSDDEVVAAGDSIMTCGSTNPNRMWHALTVKTSKPVGLTVGASQDWWEQYAPVFYRRRIEQPEPKFNVGDRVRVTAHDYGGYWHHLIGTIEKQNGDGSLCFVSGDKRGAFYEHQLEHAPFRISDHGLGVYQTRDGREEPITGRDSYGHWGTEPLFDGWYDDGRRMAHQDGPRDLVRYLRPLDKWKPTCELRLRTCTYEIGSLSRQSHRLEQKYTNGTETEWRHVEIVSE